MYALGTVTVEVGLPTGSRTGRFRIPESPVMWIISQTALQLSWKCVTKASWLFPGFKSKCAKPRTRSGCSKESPDPIFAPYRHSWIMPVLEGLPSSCNLPRRQMSATSSLAMAISMLFREKVRRALASTALAFSKAWARLRLRGRSLHQDSSSSIADHWSEVSARQETGPRTNTIARDN